jgi:hypothetical protein
MGEHDEYECDRCQDTGLVSDFPCPDCDLGLPTNREQSPQNVVGDSPEKVYVPSYVAVHPNELAELRRKATAYELIKSIVKGESNG